MSSPELILKWTQDSFNLVAQKQVEQLNATRFAVRRDVTAIGSLSIVAIFVLGTVYRGARYWTFWALAVGLALGGALGLRKERAIAKNPRAVAAKVTRTALRVTGSEGAVQFRIHFVFLAENGLGYSGLWKTSDEKGKQYSTGMLIPVLYDSSNPNRNVAWGSLSFYRIV